MLLFLFSFFCFYSTRRDSRVKISPSSLPFASSSSFFRCSPSQFLQNECRVMRAIQMKQLHSSSLTFLNGLLWCFIVLTSIHSRLHSRCFSIFTIWLLIQIQRWNFSLCLKMMMISLAFGAFTNFTFWWRGKKNSTNFIVVV